MLEVKLLYPESQFKEKRKKDLGYDCYAIIDTPSKYTILSPGETLKISLGIGLGFPKDKGGFLKERSGLAAKSIHVLGGVLDQDYIGEVSAVLYNSGATKLKISTGDRICQLVLVPLLHEPVGYVNELKQTERGEKGFGSSGV